MIKYGLKCAEGHRFESWFNSREAFEKLDRSKLLSCAICGDARVKQDLMAPQVRPARKATEGAISGAEASPPKPLSTPASPAEQALKNLRKKIEENSDNVGRDFAREARAMHAGETPERAIYGEARLDEAKSLIEDGIPVAPLPWSSKPTN